MIIVVDAGHGGQNLGALCDRFAEKDYTLSLSRYACNAFRKFSSLFRSVLIRSSDTSMSFEQRGQASENIGADLVYCLHVNANKDPARRGVELYVLPEDDIAYKVAECLLRCWPTRLRKEGRKPFVAVNDPDDEFDDWIERPISVMKPHRREGCSVVLVEVGYCSNKDDLEQLLLEPVHSGMVAAIINSACEYRRLTERASYPPFGGYLDAGR